ncbi:hypothetical protein HGB13_02715 [bacterium]|nr:hypothetical protein [bacterium]
MKKYIEKFKASYTYKLMCYIYNTFFFGNPVFLLFSLAIILNLLILFFVSFKGRPEESKIPLHYTISGGVDKTGNWYEIYYLPLFVFLFNLFNFFLANLLFKKGQNSLSFILMFASVILNIFCLFSGYIISFKI